MGVHKYMGRRGLWNPPEEPSYLIKTERTDRCAKIYLSVQPILSRIIYRILHKEVTSLLNNVDKIVSFFATSSPTFRQ